jgi:cullin-associated NEDD8-dissociated protein 1
MAELKLRRISALVEAVSNWDKDERFMALNDLTVQLGKDDLKINSHDEARVVMAVLKALTDPNNDVKSAAVKCVGVLVHKVEKTQIEVICRKLTDLIRSESKEDESLRDIYGIALKTLIEQVHLQTGNGVAGLLVEKLLGGIDSSITNIKRECLSILEQLLRRFGSTIGAQHSSIMKITLRQLSLPGQENKSVRKLSSDVLGALAVVSSDDLLNVLVNTILDHIEKAGGVPDANSAEMIIDDSGTDARTLIQTVGTISRTVGHRLGRHLKKIVPLLINVIGDVSYDGSEEDRDINLLNEIREYCFSGLESFVKCCPDQIAPHLTDAGAGEGEKGILNVAMSYVRYDPNYVGDDDDDGNMDMSDDDDYGDDDYDDDDYDDDEGDDTSWKVRRAAVRVIRAVIVARWADMSAYLFDTCVDELLSRFKERTELVRVDIMSCIGAVLEAIEMRKRLQVQVQAGAASSSSGSAQNAALASLQQKTPAVVSAICRLLGGADKELDTKSASLELAIALLDVRGEALDAPLYQELLAALLKGLVNDKLHSLRLLQMKLLRLLISLQPSAMVQASLNQTQPNDPSNIFNIAIATTNENGYKNVAEALLVANSFVPKLRPLAAGGEGFCAEATDYTQAVRSLYVALLARLEAQDIDQEIKRYAIRCTGTLFFHFGDRFQAELPHVLGLLASKLDNEVTRVATLRALQTMMESPLRLSLAPILTVTYLQTIAHFLKQQSRDTRQAAVDTLISVMRTNAGAVVQGGAPVVADLAKISSTLVASSDLHLATQALTLLHLITEHVPETDHFAESLKEYTCPRLATLASSPFLHANPTCQAALVGLFQRLVKLGVPGMCFDDFFAQLYTNSPIFAAPSGASQSASAADTNGSQESANGSGGGSGGDGKSEGTLKQEAQSVAACVAGLCAGAQPSDLERSVTVFATDISVSAAGAAAKGVERLRHLALLCIGHLGQMSDLAASGVLQALTLEDKVMACFSGCPAETQTAAAFALGNLSVGNMTKYLPLLLRNIQQTASFSSGKGQKDKVNASDYLLLVSLREIIIAHATKPGLSFDQYLPQVVPAVVPFTASVEMGERNVAAECLGLMAYLDPAAMAPELDRLFADGSAGEPEVTTKAGNGNGADADGAVEAAAKESARRAHIRWSLATLLRFAMSRELTAGKSASIGAPLTKFMPILLGDASIDVRKAAVMLATSVVHRNREWARTAVDASTGKRLILDSVFPLLLKILQFKHMIEVDTGPFKFKEDLGLPLRKACLTCVEMMVQTIPDDLNMSTLVPQVLLNIGDELKVKKDHNFNDLKIHAMQLLVKICGFSPGPVLGFVEGSLEVLKKALDEKIKDTASPTDRERALDLKRACLGVVKAYGAIDGVAASPVFTGFYVKIAVAPFVADLMREMGMSVM